MIAPVPSSTRERVQAAAAEAIAEHGYAGAGMAEIVLRCGMTRGAVYFHFASKAELAASLVHEARSDWRAWFAQIAQQGDQGLEPVRMVFEMLGEVLERDVVSRAVVRLEHEASPVTPEVGSPVDDLRDFVAHALRRAQLGRKVREDVDPVRHAAVLVASFLGVHEHSPDEVDPGTAARFRTLGSQRVATWWELVERGLAPA